ncbi:MAG: gamma-glutamyl-gamma-aminobutyrate hydrolase family protein [Chloroflexi bacterium]|nr:gamma-glutamyl-gamma-aminobutyrate hydrolase family protein [Chloroflexota bacterium]
MAITQAAQKPIIGCTVYRSAGSKEGSSAIMALTEAYIEAVCQAGGIPLMIPLGLETADLQRLLALVDAVLLPGGGDVDPVYYQQPMNDWMQRVDADRDRVEIWAAQTAVAQQKPLLAICRGHQVLNVALGGTLWADIPSQIPGALGHDYDNVKPRNYAAHTVEIAPDSRLAAALGVTHTAVNSLHHQAIRDLAPGLKAVAAAPDGIIEGVEAPDHPFAIGVQWHPEWLVADNPAMQHLFRGFVTAAGNGRSQ